jgi:cell division protein FtsX
VTVRNIAGAVSIILIAVLLAVSLFIISNTIRLAAFTRREEIAIMKMCGATNSFVRWPFLYEGLILGLLGAVSRLHCNGLFIRLSPMPWKRRIAIAHLHDSVQRSSEGSSAGISRK